MQRRWIDDQLPDHELVAALREVYRGVAQVIKRAHTASGVEVCAAPGFSRACVSNQIEGQLLCIPRTDPLPTALLNARTGELARPKYAYFERDEELIKIGREKYGTPPAFSPDPIEHALERLELSKRYLEADGYSGPSLVLTRGEDAHIHALTFAKDQPRELRVALAINAEGAWPYEGAVYASETWLQSPQGRGSLLGLPGDVLLPSDTEFFDPDPVGDRDEALIVIALAADGRARSSRFRSGAPRTASSTASSWMNLGARSSRPFCDRSGTDGRSLHGRAADPAAGQSRPSLRPSSTR